MNSSIFIGLVNNAALLLALGLLYDVLQFGYRGEKSAFQQISTGFIVGFIGIAIMLNPWDFGQGVVFDTRSVLLCISGFFLGTIPLLLAVLITSVFRLFMGGAGAWTGVAVIMTSGGIGLAWRYLHRDRKEDPTTGELYLLGIVVHITMLAWMLSLPWQVAIGVLSKITLPVMLIHPLATALMGKLMVNRGKRKQSEEALRESEEKYRQLFELESDAIFLIEKDTGKILDANVSAANIYGFGREELLRMKNVDLSAEAGKTKQATQDQLTQIPVRYHRKKDGTVFPVEITASHLNWKGREAHIAAIRDITFRVQAESTLRESENKLRATIDATPFPIAVVDLQDDKIFFWSQSAEKLFGHTAPTTTEWYQIAYPDPDYRLEVISRWKPFLEIARKSGQPVNTGEYRITCKDGSVRICELYATFLSDNLIVTFNDITERKKVEKSLKESEENYRILFDNSPDLSVSFNTEGNFLDLNKKFEEESGYSREEMIGKSVFTCGILTESSVNISIPHFEDILVGKKMILIEVEGVTKDGSKIPYELMAVPIKKDGKIVAVQATLRNITERKQTDQENEKLKAQLVQAQKMEAIGTLAGGIAHDFNNILSAIIGYTELAQMKLESDSEIKSDLKEVLTAGERAKNLVKQILAFSRQTNEELMPVQVGLIAKEALKLIRSSLPVTIDIRQNIQSKAIALSDPTQLHQIVMNLCTNAAYAMHEKGGILEVTLTDVALDSGFCSSHPEIQPGAYQKLTVSDNGHGMTADVMKQIFNPFFTTKPKDQGTGLGLSVVHGIVKGYGGMITVYSEPNKGTAFNLYFPIIAGTAEEKPEEFTIIPTGTERILVVDDEKAIIDITKKILASLGYVVEARTSSIEALALFKAMPAKFALVITDMTMPQMTGDALARELMKIRPDLPVILCTGFSEMITQEKADTMGIKAFLLKPLLKNEMAFTIRRVLDESKKKT